MDRKGAGRPDDKQYAAGNGIKPFSIIFDANRIALQWLSENDLQKVTARKTARWTDRKRKLQCKDVKL